MKNRLLSVVLSLFVAVLFPLMSWGQAKVDGTYHGRMDVINVKGKNHPPKDAVYYLQDGILSCDVPKVGKMPGKIRIEVPVTVHEDGSLSAEKGAVAGVMKMPMGIRIKLKLESFTEAQVVEGKLSFSLVVSGSFMGSHVPTEIHFVGAR